MTRNVERLVTLGGDTLRGMEPRDVAGLANELAGECLNLATGSDLDADLMRDLTAAHDEDVLALALVLVAIRAGTLQRQLSAVRQASTENRLPVETGPWMFKEHL